MKTEKFQANLLKPYLINTYFNLQLKTWSCSSINIVLFLYIQIHTGSSYGSIILTRIITLTTNIVISGISVWIEINII